LEDSAAEEEMRLLQEIVAAARNLRAENKIDPKQKAGVVLSTRGAALEAARAHRATIETLARIDLDVREAPPEAPAFQMRLDVAPAEIEAQRQRLEKEIEQLEKVMANSERQLMNEGFTSRAPAAVVESMRSKLEEYRTQVANKRAAREALSAS
jgi:valyl-tRNA synthetase